MSLKAKRVRPAKRAGGVQKRNGPAWPFRFGGWVSRASAPCFIGVSCKAKRNGCFQRCHWESLAPRPPEDGYKQEGPVHYQWVRRYNILGGDSFFENSLTKCNMANLQDPERKRGELSSDTLSPSCLSDSMDLLHLSKEKVLQHFMQLQHLGGTRSWSAPACAAATRWSDRRPTRR